MYDIAPHPDFNFKVGDVVLRLPSIPDPGEGEGSAAGEGGAGRVAVQQASLLTNNRQNPSFGTTRRDLIDGTIDSLIEALNKQKYIMQKK